MKPLFYRIVVFITGLALFLDGLALVDFLLHPLAGDFVFHSPVFRAFSILLLVPLTLMVGFLIIRRVPGNVVGPLLIVWSGSVAYFSIRAEIEPIIWSLFYTYDKLFGWLGLFLMFLHFPEGEIYPAKAARWVYGSMLINLVFSVLILMSTNTSFGSSPQTNPFHQPFVEPYADSITVVWSLTVSMILLETLVSLLLRYNKGSPLQRQQIKWLVLFGGSTVMYAILGLVAYPLLTGLKVMDPGSNLFAMFNDLIIGLFPPLAIGISVLRYHLWDLDRIIRRTLIYTILTLTLTIIYFGSVVSLQTIFIFFFPLESGDVAIVLSTLAIAAMFTPLRRRIQNAIDQRFFRQKYNAEQAIARFTATARSEVMLAPLASALINNAEETLHPEGISLWLISTTNKK